jgi:hypothetical protein
MGIMTLSVLEAPQPASAGWTTQLPSRAAAAIARPPAMQHLTSTASQSQKKGTRRVTISMRRSIQRSFPIARFNRRRRFPIPPPTLTTPILSAGRPAPALAAALAARAGAAHPDKRTYGDGSAPSGSTGSRGSRNPRASALPPQTMALERLTSDT